MSINNKNWEEKFRQRFFCEEHEKYHFIDAKHLELNIFDEVRILLAAEKEKTREETLEEVAGIINEMLEPHNECYRDYCLRCGAKNVYEETLQEMKNKLKEIR